MKRLSIIQEKMKNPAYRRDFLREALVLSLTEDWLAAQQAAGVPLWRVARRMGRRAGGLRKLLNAEPNRLTVADLADLYGALGLEIEKVVTRPVRK